MKKSILLTLLFPLLVSLSALPAMQKNNKDLLMGMPEMSEDELLKFQKEIDMQIDQFVKTLPEEEQRQFYKDVEELSQVMSTMSEEELMQFMDKVLTEEAALAPEQPAQLPTPTMPSDKKPAAEAMPLLTVEEKPKPVEVKQPEKGSQTLIAAVENTISALERFLLKAQIIPELPGDINNWVEKHKVKEWKAQLTWSQLKEKIDELVHRLKKLKERDPKKSTEYRYLGYVNEPLQNHIQRLSTQLNQHEPRVEAPAFGLGKVSKNSRNAIRDVLSALAESIYTLNMIEELDKVFKEYEPREQELTKLEQEAHKKATEESKRRPAYARAIEIGSGEPTGFIATSPSGSEQEYYGRSSYPASYDYGYDDEESDFARPTRSASGGAPSGKGSSISRPFSSTQKSKELEEEEKEGVKKDTKHIQALEAPSKKKSKEEAPVDKKAENYIKTIERQLEKVVDLFDALQTLRSLETHVKSIEPVDPAIVNAVRTITMAYTRANDQAKALKLHLKKAKSDVSKRYTSELNDRAIVYIDMLEPLITQTKGILTDPSKIRADRRYAYLGHQDALSTAINFAKDIATLIPEPASLQEMMDVFNEFKKTIALEKKKADASSSVFSTIPSSIPTIAKPVSPSPEAAQE